ncbi:MAG: SDR family oxidoreductase [Chloroflexota bacterium]
MTSSKPMHGKICMVTGATDGIGRVTAQALAEQGAVVIVVGRNKEKAEKVVQEIQAKSGNPAVEAMMADLSNQKAIRQLAKEFTGRYRHLHVLVNNAGAIFMKRQESVDGLEMTFALNHLGYFLLTDLLLDTIKASAPARIVNVSSSVHYNGQLNFDDLQKSQDYQGLPAYSQSKLANVLFTYELARRLKGSGVTTNALHPGVVATRFGANNGGVWRYLLRPLLNLFSISEEKGAQTTIYLATSPEVEGVTGEYFEEKLSKRSSDISYDETVAQRLWEVSESLTHS